MKINTFGERLKFILKEKEIRAFDLSEKTNRSRQTISNYLNNKTIPDFDFLGMLIELFPNLSLTWLITGSGEMFLNEQKKSNSEDVEELKKQIEDLKFSQDTLMGAIRTLTAQQKRSFNSVVRETGDKLLQVEKTFGSIAYIN